MKLISRYVFLLLAVFFVSPLAGKDAQHILKSRFKSFETKSAASEQNDNSDKTFFCENEKNAENNFEEDDICFKFFIPSKSQYVQNFSSERQSVYSSPELTGYGKLFLLFHALKLDC